MLMPGMFTGVKACILGDIKFGKLPLQISRNILILNESDIASMGEPETGIACRAYRCRPLEANQTKARVAIGRAGYSFCRNAGPEVGYNDAFEVTKRLSP